MSERPVLRRGAHGIAVRELHEQLTAAGLLSLGDPPDAFGPATEEALRSFQRSRALQVDGVCGVDTWSALAESQHRLGSRLLALRQPMLRGDDIRELQHRLNSLGFDAGREDGIFGVRTEAALRDFQRDAAVAADGVSGPQTVQALDRWGGLAAGTMSTTREREWLRASPRQLARRAILVAGRDVFSPIAEQLAAALGALGAQVTCGSSAAPDRDLADAANLAGADLCLLLQPFDDRSCRTAYYGTASYRSLRGFAIAARVEESLGDDFGRCAGPAARTFGILRETRMAAVVVQPDPQLVLGDPQRFVTKLSRGVQRGFEDPPDPDGLR